VCICWSCVFGWARPDEAAGWLCEGLGVSRGGSCLADTTAQSAQSGRKVHASFLASDRTYAARRVWKDMLAEGCRAVCIGLSLERRASSP
jgi:hypothetical protein